MEPSDLFCALALCNRILNRAERAGIEDAALLMHEGTREAVVAAEQARYRAGYGGL